MTSAKRRGDINAEKRLTDDAPVQVDVLPLDASSEPASGTPNAQNAD